MDLFPIVANLFRFIGDLAFEGTSLVPWLFGGDAGREDERIDGKNIRFTARVGR